MYFLNVHLSLEIITPIRGRKDMLLVSTYYHLTFRNNNPDKGTESDIPRRSYQQLSCV